MWSMNNYRMSRALRMAAKDCGVCSSIPNVFGHGERSEDPSDLLQGQALPEAHVSDNANQSPQGDSVQDW